jgi:L-ribulose-5-phosphate 4-epimerase
MIDEGYIKYECNWQQDPLPLDFDSVELLQYRDHIYQMGLIGYDAANNVGFGNISQRYRNFHFIITGTQTGHLPVLSTADLSYVISWNFEENSLKASGPARPSAESLTHAAIYEARPDINVVIHIHSADLWKKYYDKLPSTAEDIAYGTPALANAVKELVTGLEENSFLTKGHKDGIFVFGKDFRVAYYRLRELISALKN